MLCTKLQSYIVNTLKIIPVLLVQNVIKGWQKKMVHLPSMIIEVVAMTDCPGFVVPRAALLDEITANLDRSIGAIHLGTCVKLAMETAE